jgi:Caspase domain
MSANEVPSNGQSRGKDDFAIIVAVTRYPRLTDSKKAAMDLRGPINDAKAVQAWLTSKNGGGLPKDHVVHVVRKQTAPNVEDPTRGTIEDAFLNMYEQCFLDAPGGARVPKRQAGRRLYVYCSGHGVAGSRLDDAALLCSDARNSSYKTIVPYVDIGAFREAGFFEEFVVWFDGCRDWPRGGLSNQFIDYKPRLKEVGVSSLEFTAFACHSGLKAAESPGDSGVVRSVFTQTLLTGLEGDAADWNGMINGPQLKSYLEHAMSRRLPPWALADKLIDKEPAIEKADVQLFFGPTPQAAQEWKVLLDVDPAHNGAVARIWGRKSQYQLPSVLSQHRITDGKVELELRSGVYAADVPSRNIRFGFDVIGGILTRYTDDGEAMSRRIDHADYTLHVETGDPTAQVCVWNDRFSLQIADKGQCRIRLPAGIYKVQVKRGRSSLGIKEQVVVLDHDRKLRVGPPELASAAPFKGTQASGAHVEALERLDGVVHVAHGEGAKIALLARYRAPTQGTKPHLHPFQDLQLLSADGELLVDLAHAVRYVPDTGDPVSICGVAVDPGAYILRHRLVGRDIAQSIMASPGWQITVNLLRAQEDVESESRRFTGLGYIAVLMRRLIDDQAANRAPIVKSRDGHISEDQLVEVARQELASGTLFLKANLYRLLLCDFENPLAGIVGGLLLDLEREKLGADFPRAHAGLFDTVVTKLRGMVGRKHPDVEALSFRCQDPQLVHKGPIDARPMFHRSWRIIMEAAAQRPALVPLDVWERTAASGSMPPYLIWSRAASTRRASLDGFRHKVIHLSMTPANLPEPSPASRASAVHKSKKVKALRTEIARETGVPVNALAPLIGSSRTEKGARAAASLGLSEVHLGRDAAGCTASKSAASGKGQAVSRKVADDGRSGRH